MEEKKSGNSGILKISELQERLLKTAQFKHYKDIDTFFINGIKNGDISMPTNGFYCENLVPEHKQELIELYDKTFGVFDNVNLIPEAVKVSQGALLDSLHYGYDVNTGSFELYTMNPGLFDSDMLYLPEKILNDIFKKNLNGDLKCLRVDLEYYQNVGEAVTSTVTYKLVNHRKAIDDEENVLLVPIIAGIRLCSAIMMYLDQGMTLKVTQNVGGVSKVRCITQDTEVLQHYCDNPVSVALMDTFAQYYPYKGFFYAPVVGAPSTTAMVTNVHLFDLEEIRRVNSAKEMQQLGIQKAKNGLETLITELAIKTCLIQLKGNDQEAFEEVINKLPQFKEYTANIELEDISTKTVATYLHSVKNADVKKMLNTVPNAKAKYNNLASIFSKTTPISVVDIKEYLRTNAVKVIVKKADFTLSSIICTNSPEILSMVYGENYVSHYEGFSVRVRKAIDYYRSNMDGKVNVSLKDSFLRYGFSVASAEAIDKSFKDSKFLPTVEEITNVAYAVCEKKQTASKQSDNIMVRTLDAYISQGKVIDYYRYIDPRRVVSAILLS